MRERSDSEFSHVHNEVTYNGLNVACYIFLLHVIAIPCSQFVLHLFCLVRKYMYGCFPYVGHETPVGG